MSDIAEFENDPGTNIAPSATNEGTKPLLDLSGAILSGSVAHVKTFIEIGTETDLLESQNGQTPLRLALCPLNADPDRQICELLLRELANKKGWKWLEEHLNLLYKQDLQAVAKVFGCQIYANGVRCTQTELINLILIAIGLPNPIVSEDPTPTTTATEQPPNVLKGEGITTALHSAAEMSDDKIISTLSLKGDFTALDEKGRNPFLIALNKGNLHTVVLILNSMITQKGSVEIERLLCLPPYQRKDLQKLCRLLRITTSRQAQIEELASSATSAVLDDPQFDIPRRNLKGDSGAAAVKQTGKLLDRAALARLADAATATRTTSDEVGTPNLILGPGLQPARAPPGEQFWPRPENQKDPQLQQEGGGDKPLWGGFSSVNAEGMSNPTTAMAPLPVGAEVPPQSGASVAAASIAFPSAHIPDDSVQWRGLKGADLSLRMALMKGDSTAIQMALDSGADPRAPSQDCRTAFHAAPNPFALKAMLVALISTVGEDAASLHFSEGNSRYRQFHLQNFARMMGRRFRVVGRGRRLTAPELVDTIIGAALNRIEKDYPAKLVPQDKPAASTPVSTENPVVPATSPLETSDVFSVDRANTVGGVKSPPIKAALGAGDEPASKRSRV